MNIYSGNLLAAQLNFAIVISRWHYFINEKLLAGALDVIERHGGSKDLADLIYVPGSYEIPLAVKVAAESRKYDAVIALGTIVRGHTLHFDLIAQEAVKGIAQVTLSTGVPTALGILTTDTIEQALERAGSKQGNKGSEAALSAIEMSNLLKDIS